MPQVLFNNLQMQVEEYDDWRDLFDRLQSYASTKVSIHIQDRLGQMGGGNQGRTPMDIGGYERKNNVTCWECGKKGHYGRDCWLRGKGKGKGKCKGKGKGKSKGDGKSNFQGEGGEGKGEAKGKGGG